MNQKAYVFAVVYSVFCRAYHCCWAFRLWLSDTSDQRSDLPDDVFLRSGHPLHNIMQTQAEYVRLFPNNDPEKAIYLPAVVSR